MTNIQNIPNPPNAPAGFTAEWDGSKWAIVPLTENIVPARPSNIPDGFTADWNGSEWVITQIPSPPPPPPAPTPVQITAGVIMKAASYLQQVAYLTTQEMHQHITPESQAEVTQYIHTVANIMATAQQAYAKEELYDPEFPPLPTVMPQQMQAAGLGSVPFIQFIVVE